MPGAIPRVFRSLPFWARFPSLPFDSYGASGPGERLQHTIQRACEDLRKRFRAPLANGLSSTKAMLSILSPLMVIGASKCTYVPLAQPQRNMSHLCLVTVGDVFDLEGCAAGLFRGDNLSEPVAPLKSQNSPCACPSGHFLGYWPPWGGTGRRHQQGTKEGVARACRPLQALNT